MGWGSDRKPSWKSKIYSSRKKKKKYRLLYLFLLEFPFVVRRLLEMHC